MIWGNETRRNLTMLRVRIKCLSESPYTNLHLTNGRKNTDGRKKKKEELFGMCGEYYRKEGGN